jgi:hypothetical protein
VENCLWKRLWAYCKTDCGTTGSCISILTRIKSIYTFQQVDQQMQLVIDFYSLFIRIRLYMFLVRNFLQEVSYKTVPRTDTNTETGGCMYSEGLQMMGA